MSSTQISFYEVKKKKESDSRSFFSELEDQPIETFQSYARVPRIREGEIVKDLEHRLTSTLFFSSPQEERFTSNHYNKKKARKSGAETPEIDLYGLGVDPNLTEPKTPIFPFKVDLDAIEQSRAKLRIDKSLDALTRLPDLPDPLDLLSLLSPDPVDFFV